MDIQAYISSGILELYISGSLPPDEAKAVETMAATYPEIKAELEGIEQAVEAFARTSHREPSPGLLDRVMAELDEPEADTPAPVVNMAAATPTRTPWQWIAIAAGIALLISVGLNIFYFRNWQESSAQVQLLTEEKTLLADQMQRTQGRVNLIQDRYTQVIDLAGLDNFPDFFARVYWNPDQHTVLLDVEHVDQLTQSQQYQLWAIVEGQPPVSVGVFDPGKQIYQLTPDPINGEVGIFAVTIEPDGGSKAPTGEMVLLGKTG